MYIAVYEYQDKNGLFYTPTRTQKQKLDPLYMVAYNFASSLRTFAYHSDSQGPKLTWFPVTQSNHMYDVSSNLIPTIDPSNHSYNYSLNDSFSIILIISHYLTELIAKNEPNI